MDTSVSPIGTIRYFFLVLMLLIVTTGCGRPTALTPEVLDVAIDKWPGYYPLIIAQELGYMRQEGLELRITLSEDTRVTLADYAAGKYDAICVSLGDVILLKRSRAGTQVLLFSDESVGGDQIFSRERLENAEAIKGRRVGVSLGGFGEVFVRRYLAGKGLGLADVQMVNVDASKVPLMLAQGRIDIGHTWQPYADSLRAEGYEPVFTSQDAPGLILDCVVVDEALIRAKAKLLHGFINAWCKAVDWWGLHREEGSRMIEVKLGLPAGSCRLEGLKLLGREENASLLRTGPGSMEASVTEHVEHFVDTGMVVRRVKTRELIEEGFFQ